MLQQGLTLEQAATKAKNKKICAVMKHDLEGKIMK